MKQATILAIAFLVGCVAAELDHGPEAPGNLSSVPRTWELEKKYQPTDIYRFFNPPQPWTMKPVGEISNMTEDRIRIRVPNNFYENAEDGTYACGYDGITRRFFLRNLEGATSVFTYMPNAWATNDTGLWEVDPTKQLTAYESRMSFVVTFAIRPVNSTGDL